MTTPDTTEAVEDAIYYHRFAKDGGTYPANHLAQKVIAADRKALRAQGYAIVNRNGVQELDPDNVPPHFTPAEWEMHCNGYWWALRDLGLHVPGGEDCGDTTDGAGNCVSVVDGPDGRFVGARCACHCHGED